MPLEFPHYSSTDSENQVLGLFLCEPETLDVFGNFVSPQHFFNNPHQLTYKIIRYLSTKKQEITTAAICEIARIKKVDNHVNAAFLAEVMAEYVPVTDNAELIRQLDDAKRAEEAIRSLYGQREVPPRDFLQALGKVAADGILESSLWHKSKSMHEVCKEHFERADKRAAGEIRPPTPTGFARLDAEIGGISPQKLIVVAARPGIGKSALSLQIGYNVSRRDEGVLILSFEQSVNEIVSRLLSQVGEVPLRAVNGTMGDDDWRFYSEAVEIVRENKYLTIRDDIEAQIDQVEMVIQTERLTRPLSLVVIDYLQLISADHRRTLREQINDITRRLKQLARRLNLCIVLLSQVSRSAVNDKPRQPRLSDLKESGSIEQDADIVIFIHRAGAFVPDADKSETELIVAKHRDGSTGRIWARFDGRYVKFTEVNKRDTSSSDESD